ncbi:MAG: right-handed parallel beta-helix repeat-containing protein [Bacteroidales bacterium]|nr:right-handed parallel beta-helix repeat-containing protein [Bacteroidales bacterium]
MKTKLNFSLLFIVGMLFFPFLSNAQLVKTVDELYSAIEKAENNTIITLENKIFTITEPIYIDGIDNFMLDGNGATIILKSTTENVFNITNCNNFTMKDLKATHTEPDGPLGCTGNVVYIENCKNATFLKCDLNGCGMVGIAAYYCKDMMVLKSYIHKNSQYAIIYEGPNILIKGNKFENNGNDNAIYYSKVEEGQSANWPPEEKIRENLSKDGITLKKNKFLK